MIIGLSRLEKKRLKRDGKAVELKVDEVARSIAGGAASGDVGAAGLLDGDSDWGCCQFLVLIWIELARVDG